MKGKARPLKQQLQSNYELDLTGRNCLCAGGVCHGRRSGRTVSKTPGRIEFVNEGPKQYESVLNNIQNVLKALGPQCELLVIAHGPGLGLLVHTNQAEAGRIRTLMKEKVTFAACENTMTKQQVTRSDLLPGVKTVDSGVAEVIRKQEAGWAYVKSGH
jgi:intracellular sulfur oxidation DsrE/DsrF family protein